MNEVDLLNDFNGKFLELSTLIKSWNLIQVSSKSEFDDLTKKLLINLYEENSETKIKRILESELCVTYGLYNFEFNSDKLTNEIMIWWNK